MTRTRRSSLTRTMATVPTYSVCNFRVSRLYSLETRESAATR